MCHSHRNSDGIGGAQAELSVLRAPETLDNVYRIVLYICVHLCIGDDVRRRFPRGLGFVKSTPLDEELLATTALSAI